MSDLLDYLRDGPLQGTFGSYTGDRSAGVTDFPGFAELSASEQQVIEEVRRGERSEAIVVHRDEYLLFEHAPSGMASDYTNGKQWGYSVRNRSVRQAPRSKPESPSDKLPGSDSNSPGSGNGLMVALATSTVLALAVAGLALGTRRAAPTPEAVALECLELIAPELTRIDSRITGLQEQFAGLETGQLERIDGSTQRMEAGLTELREARNRPDASVSFLDLVRWW